MSLVHINAMMRVRIIAKLIVSDAVPGCDLEQVRFNVERLTLTVTGKTGIRETLALRVFVPEFVEGECSFIKSIFHRLVAMCEQTAGEERAFYQWVISMVRFYLIYPELDPHRTRHFNLKTLDHSETFHGITQLAQITSLPKPKRLIKFAGEITAPTGQLLLNAMYLRPDLRIPLGRPDYIAFREQCLSEMMRVMEWSDGIKRDAIEKVRHHIEKVQRDIESNTALSADQRAEAMAELTSQMGKGMADLHQLHLECVRSVMEEALEIEDRQSPQFADLVQEAHRLQEPIGKEVAETHIERLAEDGVSLTPEYISCIQARLDTAAVDRLLWQTILRFEEVFGLAPLRGIQLIDLPESIDDIMSPDDNEIVFPDDVEATIDQAIPQEPEFEEYLCFWSAYLSDDILEKWSMVCWITAHLINRNECVRSLQREAESVYHGVLDYAFKEAYRKIRRRRTVPERRAYVLLYFRQPLFNYHVAVTNPIIMSFFMHMDAETQTLILLVLVFKMREWGGEKDLHKELERRWRAYLRFYPYWLDIIQDEEREAKRQQGAQRKTLSLHHPIFADEDGNELRLEDTLAGPPSKPANLLQAVTLEDGAMLENWAKTYCTAKQAIHVVGRFRDGKTETEIAKEDRISQQAVSKSIRPACKRIREGLIRDGVLEAG
jgi:hypothetical protein